MWIPHIYLRLLGVSPNRLQLTIHVKVSRKNNDRFTNASYTEVSYCLSFGKILWTAVLIGSDKLWSGLISPLSHFPSEPAPTQAQAQTLSSTLEPQQRWTKLIAFHANHYVFRRTSQLFTNSAKTMRTKWKSRSTRTVNRLIWGNEEKITKMATQFKGILYSTRVAPFLPLTVCFKDQYSCRLIVKIISWLSNGQMIDVIWFG